jgi:hypothetical protein
MPIFETLDECFKYANAVTLLEVAEVVEDLGVEALNKVIYTEVYRYTDNFADQPYEHTYGLMNQAQSDLLVYDNKKVPKTVELSIDPKGKYPSFYENGNSDNSDFIVKWIDEGHKGYYLGQKINEKPKNIFEKTAQRLLKGGFLKNAITNRLKFLGYEISRTPSSGGE